MIIIIGLALLAGAGVLALNRPSRPSQELSNPQGQTQGRTANVFNLGFRNYAGENIALSSFQGKPLVVNAWATWCPFCVKELKDFATLQSELGDEVTIIAIDRSESLGQAKGYTDDVGVTDKIIFLLDPTDSFYQAIGGFSMPETIFINKSGGTVIHKRGPMDLDEMREKVKQIL